MDECKPLLHGHTAAGDQGCGHGGLPSRAVQVDPIKPNLKPPGTKRLKLKYDTLLSNVAFKFNMRRYTLEGAAKQAEAARQSTR